MIERLSSDWLFRMPIDFEYNKYILLNYIKNSESRLNQLKIYPDLQEITLNIVNIASVGKDNKIISLDKIINEFDDEINLSDFKYELIPELTPPEQTEVSRTINFSYPKLLDLFNFAKSIWMFAFDNIDLNIKKNKNASLVVGYFYYYSKFDKSLHLYSFDFSKGQSDYSDYNEFKEVFSGYTNNSISIILSLINESGGDSSCVIYEAKSDQELPIKETLIPIIKRKLILKNKPILSEKKYIS
jgi:hypothetical protein